MSAFNQAGDVCYDKGSVLSQINYAQVRLKRGEGIVSDFRLGGGGGGGSGGGDSGGDVIKIGHYASLTGDTATFGTSADEGAQLALDEINRAGAESSAEEAHTGA